MEDLKNHLKCFVLKQIDKDWIWIIKHRIGPWVAKKGNSGLWDCVNVYSQYRGILNSGLIRKDFAALIVDIHPDGLSKGKTKEQLKGSMDHCTISIKLNQIENYPKHDERWGIVNELKKIFDAPVPDLYQETTTDTIESRIKEYFQKRIATDQYASLRYGETYCGYTTTLSIERYASEIFKSKKIPSSILVVECIDTKVSDDMISLMVGRYSSDSKIKLIIAASSGFDERIKKIATERNVCLIRVNPQYEVDENNILTPRMDGGSGVNSYEHKMLSDKVPMTVPLVIQDGNYITTSLTDFLQRCNIPVNNPGCAHAPKLTRDFIEGVVSQIIMDDEEKYVTLLENCSMNDKIPYCIIDPYKYAREDKLTISRSDLSKQKQLGHIDWQKGEVRLSAQVEHGSPRDRFSMAHEYGHHKLHSHPRFREFLILDAELESEAASDIWEKHWLEVQANVFASFMLMPRRIVSLLYNIYYRKWFKTDKVEPLYVTAPVYNDRVFQNVVGPVARHVGVSLDAMRIRLQDMGLMYDIIEVNENNAV